MTPATVTPPPQPQPIARGMTAEEFGLKHIGDRVEYIDGFVKEIPMPGGKHGKACNWAAFYLTQHVLANNLGHVFSNDTFLKVPTRTDPERVYGPDVFFVAYDRLARDAAIPKGILAVVPNVVVEVRSPSDSWSEIFVKVGDYLGIGVPAVVVIDPDTVTVSVYRSDPTNPQQILKAADTLTLPDVLPGLSVPVQKLLE